MSVTLSFSHPRWRTAAPAASTPGPQGPEVAAPAGVGAARATAPNAAHPSDSFFDSRAGRALLGAMGFAADAAAFSASRKLGAMPPAPRHQQSLLSGPA